MRNPGERKNPRVLAVFENSAKKKGGNFQVGKSAGDSKILTGF